MARAVVPRCLVAVTGRTSDAIKPGDTRDDCCSAVRRRRRRAETKAPRYFSICDCVGLKTAVTGLGNRVPIRLLRRIHGSGYFLPILIFR